MNDTLTAVPGFRVGHWTDDVGITGCTVILCPPGTVGGVDQRGGAPGTRETDLLRPMHLVQSPTAILLTGGSAFGLAAADGVMRWCVHYGIGYSAPDAIVPIVPSAVLYDLGMGDSTARPGPDAGYAACEAASGDPVSEGSVGAGTGCRVGALAGNTQACKGGVGSAVIALQSGLIVGALVAVNPFGGVVDETGHLLAGLRVAPGSGDLIDVTSLLAGPALDQSLSASANTVIGVIATNARLTNEGANVVAMMAHDGLARAIRPAHTQYDGDTLFALASGEVAADPSLIGALGADVLEQAIRRAVRRATSLGGVLAIADAPTTS